MSSFPPGLVLIGGAALLLLLPRAVRPAAFLVFPALAFGLLVSMEPGDELTVAFLDFRLVLSRVDKLSLVFGYIFTIIAFLGGIYALHLRDRGQQVAGLLYAGSALGVVFAGDLFTLVIFWELLALSSVYSSGRGARPRLGRRACAISLCTSRAGPCSWEGSSGTWRRRAPSSSTIWSRALPPT